MYLVDFCFFGGKMKKFLISKILTFISFFIIVSGLTYYFYERIDDVEIDSEISNEKI